MASEGQEINAIKFWQIASFLIDIAFSYKFFISFPFSEFHFFNLQYTFNLL
jgi:hypothetical protein